MSRQRDRRPIVPPTNTYARLIANITFRSNAAPRRSRSRSRSPGHALKEEPRPKHSADIELPPTKEEPHQPAPPPPPPVDDERPLISDAPPSPGPAPPAPPPAAPVHTNSDPWNDLGDLQVLNLTGPAGAHDDDEFIFRDRTFNYGHFDPNLPALTAPLFVAPPPLPAPPPPTHAPAPPPATNPALVDSFVQFAREMRPPALWSESEFLHMHGHMPEDADAARLPGEAPATAAGQHRPLGSVMFMNKLPAELRTCPCHCNTRNPCSDMAVADLLRQFMRIDYLRDGEPLHLMLPNSDLYAAKGSETEDRGFLGHFRVHGDAFTFVDAGTGELHCCATMWAYVSYLAMVWESEMTDTVNEAKRIRSQLMLRSNTLRFVRVQDLNLTLWQIGASYRHDLGTWVASRPHDATRARVPLKDPPPEVRFKTRDELRAFFASVANIEYPELNIWMTAQARRIRMQRQIIEGYRQQIAHLVQRLRDNNK